MGKFRFSNKSSEILGTVHVKLQKIGHRALEISPMDFGYSSGLRTTMEQQELFRNKKSQLDGIIKKSKHQTGRAIDFFAVVNGQGSWDIPHLAVIMGAHMQAAAELGIRLKSGGMWKDFPDWPHLELDDNED